MKSHWQLKKSKIKTFSKKLFVIISIFAILTSTISLTTSLQAIQNQGSEFSSIRCGWYSWQPYQYEQRKDDVLELTGLDVQLFREVFEEEMNLNLNFEEIGWEQQLLQLKGGEVDVAAGAFPLEEREKYAYFSKPYRYEEIVIYTKRDNKVPPSIKTNSQLTSLLNKKSLRIGIVPGYFYGDILNDFINNPGNKDRLVPAGNAEENLSSLIEGDVDLVPVDHLVGATLAWKHQWSNSIIDHELIAYKSPIVALFSKKSTTPELVKEFNNAMEESRQNGQYSRIIRRYLFPVLLNMTVAQDWFFGLEVLGIVAFALSGVVLAHRETFSLFGALVIAALPSVGGGVIRDLIASRSPLSMVGSPHYVLIVIGVVLTSFLFLRLIPRRSSTPNWLRWMPLVDVLDAIGLAAFTIVGVIIAVETGSEPLVLWGPTFSALGGAGGAILRDIVRGDADHPTLRHEVYAEIALVWGLALSVFVAIYANQDNFDPVQLQLAVLITLVGTLTTRLLILKLNLKSPLFR